MWSWSYTLLSICLGAPSGIYYTFLRIYLFVCYHICILCCTYIIVDLLVPSEIPPCLSLYFCESNIRIRFEPSKPLFEIRAAVSDGG